VLRTTGSFFGTLGRATRATTHSRPRVTGVEEPEGEACLPVDVPGGLPLLEQVEQVGADVLGAEAVGRGVEVAGEVGDVPGVGADGLGGPVAEGHVLGHAAAQRGHSWLPSRRCARTGSPSAASMIGERSRVWSDAVENGRRERKVRRVRKRAQAGTWSHGRSTGVAFGPPRSGLVVCRACSTAWGCKSPAQPDGGEVRAKRKGVAARRGLKEAWSKAAT
jgi:hypothetical protein